MDILKIEIHLTTNELSAEQKLEVLDGVREKVREYVANPPEFLDIRNVRIFKHMTNEEIANALIKSRK